jgi:hypothetical protein
LSKKLAGLALAKIRFDQCVKFIVPLMGPSDGRLDLLSARGIPHAPIEVAEILAHLVEREPEGEKALRGVQRQTKRQALVASRSDRPGAVGEGGFGSLERRGLAPSGQRVRTSAQVIGYALCNAQEQRSEPRLNCVRKRLGGGSSEHDEVVTEPKQRPEQRSQVGVGGEEAYPFVPGLDGDRLRLLHGLAEAVLDSPVRRRIERPQKPLKQLR